MEIENNIELDLETLDKEDVDIYQSEYTGVEIDAAIRNGLALGSEEDVKDLKQNVYNIKSSYTNHITADNPHGVTAAQVGARPDTWTPTAAEVGAAPESHLSDKSNPHTVTKAQIGLGKVDNTSDTNKPISTKQQAALDLKADKTALTEHTQLKNNPHSVTYDQVGAAPAGLHRSYGSLKDIGITSFPTTMSEVANAMPANSMIVIDTRTIMTGGAEEISDWGNTSNGTAYINRGYSIARVTMLILYGSGTSVKGRLYVGNWACETNTVNWTDYGYDGNTNYPGCFYRTVDGVTEWINPPMITGTGYLTTERLNGEPIYKAWGSDGILYYRFKDSEPWTPYFQLTGAAPAGYGLGEGNGKYCTDCDTAVINGFYYLSGEDCVNSPPNSLLNYGPMLVERRAKAIHQTATYDNIVARRSSVDSGKTWGEWEYENPPMFMGGEYRTTGRMHGEAVYVKLDDNGIVKIRRESEGESDWRAPAAELGAAPAGYGLGTNGVDITDWNMALYNGFVREYIGTDAGHSPFIGKGSWGYVSTYSTGALVQVAFCNSGYDYKNNTLQKIRVRHSDGTWGEWEWVNPPMQLGVEYRTTERWNGKSVWTVAIPAGIVGTGDSHIYTDFTCTEFLSMQGHIYDVDGEHTTVMPSFLLNKDGTCKLYFNVRGYSLDGNLHFLLNVSEGYTGLNTRPLYLQAWYTKY